MADRRTTASPDATVFPTFRDATLGFTDATAITIPPPVAYAALPPMPMMDATGGLGSSFVETPMPDALSSIDFGPVLGPLPTLPSARDMVRPAPPKPAQPAKPPAPRQAARQAPAGPPALPRQVPPQQPQFPVQRGPQVTYPPAGQPVRYPQQAPPQQFPPPRYPAQRGQPAGRAGTPAGWAGNPPPATPAGGPPGPPVVYRPEPTNTTTTATPKRADVPVTPPLKGMGKKIVAGAAIGAGVLAKAGAIPHIVSAVGNLHLAGILGSIGLYSLLFTWKFAVGLVAMIFLHEMGHYVAMRRLGLKPDLPHLIPLIGGYTRMRNQPTSVAQEAWTALAGPMAGAAVAGVTLAIGDSYHQAVTLQLAYLGFVMTLFNLIPYGSLDGGRVAKALHPGTWFAILLFIVIFLVSSPSPQLGIVAVVMLFLAIRRLVTHVSGGRTNYYAIDDSTRLRIAGLYWLTVIACAVGAYYVFTLLVPQS